MVLSLGKVKCTGIGSLHIGGIARPYQNAVEKILSRREPAKIALGVDEDDKLAEERQSQA